MAKYKIELTWNGQTVLTGEASAVMTWNSVRHLLIDNFAGEDKVRGEKVVPSLTELILCPIGTKFMGSNKAIGHGAFLIERIG